LMPFSVITHGRDPVSFMTEAVEMLKVAPAAALIRASPRELLNVFQADDSGCQVITVTNELIKKLSTVVYDLVEYSLDTVELQIFDETSLMCALPLI
jgi:transaldolase